MSWLRLLPERLLDKWITERPRLHRVVALAIGCALAFGTLWDCLSAAWDPIDDHEIVSFLLPSGSLSIGRLFGAWLETEAGHAFNSSRYRPTYYFLRLVETFLWGARPQLWYAARMVMFAVALAALIWSLRGILSWLENACLAAFLLTLNFWYDIFARLGPGETYTVLGISLFAVGTRAAFELRAKSETRQRPFAIAAALIFAGGVIAVGSKENMLFLAVPALYLVARTRPRGPERWIFFAAAAVIAFTVFVTASVMVGVKRGGHIYKEDTSSEARIELFTRWIGVMWSQLWEWFLGGIALAAVASTVEKMRRGSLELARKSALALGGVIALVLLIAMQGAFYGGKWPDPANGSYCCARYNFPGLLAPAMIAWVAYAWLVAAARALGTPGWLLAWGRLACVALAISSIHTLGFPLRAGVARTVARTRDFTSRLETVIGSSRARPGAPLVFEIFHVWDYEQVTSLQDFLQASGVRVPVYMRVHLDPNAFGGLEKQLVTTMQHVAANGGTPPSNFGMTKPFREFKGPPCVFVGFHGGVGTLGCSMSTVFW